MLKGTNKRFMNNDLRNNFSDQYLKHKVNMVKCIKFFVVVVVALFDCGIEL